MACGFPYLFKSDLKKRREGTVSAQHATCLAAYLGGGLGLGLGLGLNSGQHDDLRHRVAQA